MGNMSYCRFQNTLGDLRDCYDNWDLDDDKKEELKAREKLIKLCCDIASDFGGMVTED
jgi:hypothetical protein